MSFGGGSSITPYKPPGPPDPNVGKHDGVAPRITRITQEEQGTEPSKTPLLSGATAESEEELRRRANPSLIG